MLQINLKRLISTTLPATVMLAGLLVSTGVQAQWVEATSSAPVRNGNKAMAKNKAVQDAIKEALMFAGASISSVQQVTDGLLTQDDLRMTSHGSIQQLELVEELYQKGEVWVTIRADIIPEEKQCFSADFQKSVAITQFTVKNREQAKVGGLYQIGKAFSQRLFNQMHQESKSILARPWLQQKINNSASFEQYYDNDLRIIDTIGESSESQFVLLGEISDLSFGEQTSNDLAFWQKKQTERYFAIDLLLYNTSTKEQIYRQQFDTVGNWSNGKKPNVHGKRFWQTTYGSSIDELIDEVHLSVEGIIHCQPVQGKIVKVDDNQIQFNLGSDHGVTKGQVFSIIHQSHFITENGKHLPRFVISPYQVKVMDVYTKTSIAQSVNDELLSNIQTTDHVILKEIPEIGFD